MKNKEQEKGYSSIFLDYFTNLEFVDFSKEQKEKIKKLLIEHNGDILPAYLWLLNNGKDCSPRDVEHFSTHEAMLVEDIKDPWSIPLHESFKRKLNKEWSETAVLGWINKATRAGIDALWIAEQLKERYTLSEFVNLKRKYKMYSPEEKSKKTLNKLNDFELEELKRRYYNYEDYGYLSKPTYDALVSYAKKEWNITISRQTLAKKI
jgi:hypothetical protein